MPERVLTNDDLLELVDTNDEWIIERTGISERRIAAEDEALTDICLPAARRALEMAGVEPRSIDLLIVATVTPDMAFPSSSALLADTLGMPDAAAYDLSAGCTGFVYAIAQAHAMLAAGLAEAGAGRRRRRALEDPRLDATARRSCSSATAPVPSCMERGRGRGLPRLRARRRRRRRREPLAARLRLAEVRRSRQVRQDERP